MDALDKRCHNYSSAAHITGQWLSMALQQLIFSFCLVFSGESASSGSDLRSSDVCWGKNLSDLSCREEYRNHIFPKTCFLPCINVW
jgi:hypothetical protein